MEPDPDVLEMVRRQLDRDPPPSTEALYGRAASLNSDIYELSLRQFNATYVLRVKRERKRSEEEGGADGSGRGGSGGSGAEGGEAADEGDEDEVEPRPGGFLDALRDAGDGEEPDDDAPASEASATAAGARTDAGGRAGARFGLRERVRSILWRYARQVAARPGLAGALAAVDTVDERVEEILRLAGGDR